jgi:uncharacterized protein (DUF305 family)
MQRSWIYLIFAGVLALVLAACALPQQSGTSTTNSPHPSDMSGMDHDSRETSAQAPFDAQFIDGMTIHHTSAVAMAEQALNESQRPEIKQLAQNIIATQNQEIEQMATWRQQWYPNVATTQGTGGHMGDMELSSDTSIPFDQRFITAMISHHNGAIEMAKEAQTKAEHPEIKQLAGEIITAQEAEVQQLQEWEQTWFGE